MLRLRHEASQTSMQMAPKGSPQNRERTAASEGMSNTQQNSSRFYERLVSKSELAASLHPQQVNMSDTLSSVPEAQFTRRIDSVCSEMHMA